MLPKNAKCQTLSDSTGWLEVLDSAFYLEYYGQGQTTGNTVLDSIFLQYNVAAYSQALPFAETPLLQRLFDVVCDCDLDSLTNVLKTTFPNKFGGLSKDILVDSGRHVGYYNPSDYMWQITTDSTYLWHLKKIQAAKAWDITTGDTNITIGVIDYVPDISHPDLATEILLPYDPYNPAITYDCSPWHYHGTTVAAFASGETAETNTTSLGQLASIGFNTKIYMYASYTFPINIVSRWDFLQKALHAVNVMGVKVIVTCSGAGLFCTPPTSVPIEKAFIHEILENGTSIVMAAGNGLGGYHCGNISNGWKPFYPFHPSYDDRIIIVSSTGKDDKHQHFELDSLGNPYEVTHSHFPAVDVCAPGYDLMGADATNCGANSWPYYGEWGGTSFSSPIVAGLISLMYSINPCLSTAQVQAIIKATTDPIADAANYPGMVGTGRVNAYKAVKTAQDVYSAVPDLYVRDRKEDYGAPGCYHWQADRYNSPDIWVRNQQDGLTNQIHENPEYQINSPVYVYVRVNNKGCMASSGEQQLKIYWSKASSWSSWAENWNGTQPLIGDLIDSITIPAIQPGKDTILKFTWNITNPPKFMHWSTCLMARITGPNQIIYIYPDRLDDDVYFNNNIAMKNLMVIDSIGEVLKPNVINGDTVPFGIYVFTGNPHDDTVTTTIQFAESGNGGSLTKEGEVTVILDSIGWQLLSEKILNNSADFIHIDTNKHSFVIANPKVKIENIAFPPNTRIPMYVGFSFLTEAAESQTFGYHIRQYLPADSLLGGQHFIIQRNGRTPFYADAGPDQEITTGQSATLTAVPINETAIYNWYDAGWDLIDQGQSIQVQPSTTTTYTLEVISLQDGYKDYDDVQVSVLESWIESIVPNPATTNVQIKYTLAPAVQQASIMLLNSTGTWSKTYSLAIHSTKININISPLQPGWFTVVLLTNQIAADAETLIVQ